MKPFFVRFVWSYYHKIAFFIAKLHITNNMLLRVLLFLKSKNKKNALNTWSKSTLSVNQLVFSQISTYQDHLNTKINLITMGIFVETVFSQLILFENKWQAPAEAWSWAHLNLGVPHLHCSDSHLHCSDWLSRWVALNWSALIGSQV